MKGVRISICSEFPNKGYVLFYISIGRNKYISIFDENRGKQICNIYDDTDQFGKNFITDSIVSINY